MAGTWAKLGVFRLNGKLGKLPRAFSDQSENALAHIWRATLSDQIESSIQSDRMLL
jgi:hypothetical protein